jgi:hypothetical protein
MSPDKTPAAALPPIPDCDGVSDCYFSAAGALARVIAEGRPR